MQTYDNREERTRTSMYGKKKFVILPLLLLIIMLFVLVDVLPNHYRRRAADVADRFREVDRVVVSVEGMEPYTITAESELTVYKDVLEPTVIFSGAHKAIQDAVLQEVAEISFYIGTEELVRETLYLLDESAGEEWGRPTEVGLLIGWVDGKFRRLGS